MALSVSNDEMERNGNGLDDISDAEIITMPSEDGRNIFFTDQDSTFPIGKEYHLYFVYSSEDAIFVRQKVESLESPPSNLKCCFRDRDFTPRVPTHENIDIFMPKCMKVVLVLTPDFFLSGWCRHEEQIATALSSNNGMEMITLVHKPCKIPERMKSLKYIHETRTNEADGTIKKAVFTKGANGAGIVLGSDETSVFAYCWEIRDVTQQDVDALRDIGANVFLADLVPLICTVNDSMFSYGFMPYLRHGRCIRYCAGFLMFALIQLMIAVIILVADSFSTMHLYLLFPLLPINFGIVVFSCWCFKKNTIKKVEKKVNSILTKTNLILYRRAKVIVSFRADSCPKVFVSYYDSQPCKNHIQQALRNAGLRYEQESDFDSETDPDNYLEAIAVKLIDELVTKFAPKFARWEELPPAHNFRHQTKEEKMCLCQLYDFVRADRDKRSGIVSWRASTNEVNFL